MIILNIFEKYSLKRNQRLFEEMSLNDRDARYNVETGSMTIYDRNGGS